MRAYFICHGVYSWVPASTRQAILRICGHHLTPSGVALVSYNTYPGWKAKEVVRDAMMMRARTGGEPQTKLALGLGMVDFLERATPPDSLVRKAIQQAAPSLKDPRKAPYVFHEYLERINAPCYFQDFITEAQDAGGLGYLANASIGLMFTANYGLSPEDQQALASESRGNQVHLEQLLDFVANRTFRSSLLVKRERLPMIRYEVPKDRLRALSYVLELNEGTSLDPSDPMAKALAHTLSAATAPVTFKALLESACESVRVPRHEIEDIFLSNIAFLVAKECLHPRL